MALIHSFEQSGNYLFKNRGQIPAILFLLAIPVIYFTKTESLCCCQYNWVTYSAIAISISGFLFRAWAIGTTPRGTSGRNTKAQVAESLNTKGIYSIVRHPLYVGNFFMWIGIVIFTFNIYFVIIVSLAYWLYYERIMFAEEQFLTRKFSDDYLTWSLNVPAFIPRIKNYIKSDVSFSLRTVLRREYASVFSMVFGYVFVDYLRYYFQGGDLKEIRNSLIILIAFGVLTLILRSLKHYTKILHQEDRS